MQTNTMTITPLSPLGAEVHGLDLSKPLSGETEQALAQAFSDYALLLFRDQELRKEDLMRVARVFGPLSDQGEAPGGLNLVSNVTPKGMNAATGEMTLPTGDGELVFHFDHCFQEHPLKGIMLYSVEIPPVGGDTLFSDMRLATRALPDDIRARIDGRTIRHKSEARTGNPEANHPILYTHPRTGERVLFFSKLHAREIEGLSHEESQDLFKKFIGMVENKDIMYRHVWRPKDVVVWDNIALQHAREVFDPKYKRHLQRVQIG
ncbi:MAG TPA: TauD/TfdA family dioxygenase [Bordetella sp.]|nr:TauD/TfdA family dioxygenase [Bordetella sp.]